MQRYPIASRPAVLATIDWTGRILVSVLTVATLAFLIAVLFFRDPNARTMAERQRMEAIEAESRAFCQTFGMPVGSERYDECAAELMKIRELHQKRLAADEQSIL